MTSHDIGTNIGIFNQYQQHMICTNNVIEILSGLNCGIVMSNEQQKQLPQISHTAHCDLNAVQLGFVCLCEKKGTIIRTTRIFGAYGPIMFALWVCLISPWGQSWERVFHKHKCIQFIALVHLCLQHSYSFM